MTGAGRRVGREIALALAQSGAHILLHYHTSGDDAKKTAHEIQTLGVPCELFGADFEDPAEVRGLAKKVLKNFPIVDVLVNSASLFYKTPIQDVKDADWDTLLDVNLKAPFILSTVIGCAMSKNGSGSIVNIADWSGFRPYRDHLPYCVSKGGLLTLTKALARDLAPHVRANAVAPGPVLLPEDFSQGEKEAVIKKVPLGRVGSPRDVAEAVLFLVQNDYVNGFILTVDGGRSIHV